ncbi:hypothetical protein PtA15_2A467 [Puccinia triticina]|uniref:Uncharacterized protein n=1 Tax=Puccinia triticina TaxID=208348 RepID=A0ABY7CH96_9BASI|nr:uncharacterized protein PtA15_2A467 [Puccinia triticina]WAQ82152.1 hypothetical protein PtA15_2A467 [Puccinia triticina]
MEQQNDDQLESLYSKINSIKNVRLLQLYPCFENTVDLALLNQTVRAQPSS